jgi:hypothetical protein
LPARKNHHHGGMRYCMTKIDAEFRQTGRMSRLIPYLLSTYLRK